MTALEMQKDDHLFTEAITLKAFPYQDKAFIVKAFSKERGLLSLFVKRETGKSRKLFLKDTVETAIASGLVKAELDLIPRSNGLWRCQRATVVHDYPFLRRDFDCLSIASRLLGAILTTQMPESAAPLLYDLLDAYLKKLSESPYPTTLLTSFQLKLLKYDGLLHEETFKEWLQKEALPFSPFTEEEYQLTLFLLSSRSLSEIASQPLSFDLQEKVNTLFLFLNEQKHF
ncbi:MAG: recO [Chlamydiales bacterium]|nr:recO [Chlamydiales bacterium]